MQWLLAPLPRIAQSLAECICVCEKWKVLKCFPLFCVNAKHNCPTTTQPETETETKTQTMTKTITMTMTMTSERCQLLCTLLFSFISSSTAK